MCPEVDSALWKWVPRISPGVKAAGAFGWRPIILVVPKRQEIRGLNLPGTTWATSACRGTPLLYFRAHHITLCLLWSFKCVRVESACVLICVLLCFSYIILCIRFNGTNDEVKTFHSDWWMGAGEVNEILTINCFKNSVQNNIEMYESKQVNEEEITWKKDENRDEKMLLTLQQVLNFWCVEMRLYWTCGAEPVKRQQTMLLIIKCSGPCLEISRFYILLGTEFSYGCS